MTVRACECCGHPLPEYEVLMDFTAKQQQLFAIVHRAGRAGIGREQIMDKLYSDDPDGGPESLNIIAVMHRSMKPVLQKHGLKFRVGRGSHAAWRLEKIGA